MPLARDALRSRTTEGGSPMSAVRWFSTGALSLILVGLAFMLPALAHPADSPSGQARGEQFTMDLVRLITQYQLAAGGQKAAIEGRLLAAPLTREQELL